MKLNEVISSNPETYIRLLIKAINKLSKGEIKFGFELKTETGLQYKYTISVNGFYNNPSLRASEMNDWSLQLEFRINDGRERVLIIDKTNSNMISYDNISFDWDPVLNAKDIINSIKAHYE